MVNPNKYGNVPSFTFYDGYNRTRIYEEFDRNLANICDLGFNDLMSSITFIPVSEVYNSYVELYIGVNYTGDFRIIYGDTDLRKIGFDNRTSFLRTFGTRVNLHYDPTPRSRYRGSTGNVNLGRDGYNNQISYVTFTKG